MNKEHSQGQNTYINPDGNRELVACADSEYTYPKDSNACVIKCKLGLFGGEPKPTDCFGCSKYRPKFQILRYGKPVGDAPEEAGTNENKEPDVPQKSRGLGDTIAKATKAFGIKPCGACKKRQEKLNKMFSYKSNKANGGCKDCKDKQKEA
tara:strand:+ start:105 stop:557 length:453 start_codon:yes stop_codon:yes gene_type:complete